MGDLRDALNYPLLKAGLIALFVALIISAAGLYRVNKSYSSSGTLGEGMHYLGEEGFERGYVYYNRTLFLYSPDANLSIIQGEKVTNYTLINRRITIHPVERPKVYVFNGSVSYIYNATAVDYPYAIYSLLAFVLMLVGIALSFIGYNHFLRDLKEGEK